MCKDTRFFGYYKLFGKKNRSPGRMPPPCGTESPIVVGSVLLPGEAPLRDRSTLEADREAADTARHEVGHVEEQRYEQAVPPVGDDAPAAAP